MFKVAVCFLALTAVPHALATASLESWANDAGTGVFLMRQAPGQPVWPAVLLNTNVNVRVSGPVAHVTVRQSFLNQGKHFGEAYYVFPLPETAAVHAMSLTVGERRIVGEIREKAQAKQIYEAARREGRRAGLVEQMRPNLFTTSVANIAAGERVEVTVEYTQTLIMDGSRADLRFPMTLTPRYRPEPGNGNYHPLDLPAVPPVGAVSRPRSPSSPQAPDPARTSSPSDQLRSPEIVPAAVGATPLAPAPAAPTAAITVQLDPGHRLAAIESSSHPIQVRDAANVYRVSLPEDTVPMDRDFLLHWELADGGVSRAGFFSEVVAGEHYGLLLLTPPDTAQTARLPREVIFIIDTSGSMGGASIQQARQALAAALRRLEPTDRFNVIEFDSSFSALFDGPVPAAAHRVTEALAFVLGLEAGGGTEMLPALQAALAMPRETGHLRQVVFITDGAVANETAIFSLLHQRLGGSRLFTVGIGSAPNSYFMRKAAEFGRGTFTYVSATGEVQERMSALFRKLESPVLQDIEVELPAGVEGELWPRRIPDLYLGEPVLVAMKLNRIPSRFAVSGKGPAPWERIVPVSAAGGHAGVAKVWARQKVEALMDRVIRGEPEAEVRADVVEVALTHDLVSRYTSLVAVDRTPVRHGNDPLVPRSVPNAVPHGFEFPATAVGLERLWLYGGLCLLAAALVAAAGGRRRPCSG